MRRLSRITAIIISAVLFFGSVFAVAGTDGIILM